MKRTNTSIILEQIINNDFPSHSEFATICGIDRTKLSRDISGRTAYITDSQFSEYISHMRRESQMKMIQARLMDIIPEGLHSELIFNQSDMIKENFQNFPLLQISPALKSALEWLADEIARCPELEDPILTICRRLGWKPNEQKKVKY